MLGDPDGAEPWCWRINGHHLAVHVVVTPGGTTFTPHYARLHNADDQESQSYGLPQHRPTRPRRPR
ncbi:DUF3500 domain-containing protein [Plantactinospora sp. KLBMP9567]|uniref:DUF3500 domain-containing protein n=1 Tax=Plantactinospora sp. KLBMP9567 TaxID=3085900 RepID=UPI002981581A|nr:DUF3500 domain-containing protein [Plantactinospora sp. KLBMP9567]MDW5322237.1 DUF3500 domain-containing protein [Plantactinospora sp. KLBMP9567]